jgi:hypothetical protein
MIAGAELRALDALGPAGAYRSRATVEIPDVTGRPAASLSLVPRLFVSRTMAALHRAATPGLDDRVRAIAHAGEAFRSGIVGGVGPADYHWLVSRVAGTPISTVRAAADRIARAAHEAYRGTLNARPAGAGGDWRDPLTRTGQAVWTRRGDVFGVHAAGNHPAVHAAWLEALALGYRVAVRPSRREPFTPHRLVCALRSAGLGDDQVVLLPTDHDAAGEMLRGADLSIVYGGDEVIRRYAGAGTVLPQGPGRSKILVTADVDWRDFVDMIVRSVSHEGGGGCVNATAVFVEGDPSPVARAVAERLAEIPSLPPDDDRAVLSVVPQGTAERMAQYLRAKATGTTSWLDGIVDDLGDGSAALRPAVHQVDRPDAPQTRLELPFPCVWFAPWTRAAGIEPLRDTLVLAVASGDAELIDRLVAEPSISNIHVGDRPTYWTEPGLPHDDYLAGFLMRSKAVVRG